MKKPRSTTPMTSPPSPSMKPISNTPVQDADAESELTFLSSRSKSEIVNMLLKHTYLDELAQSRCLTSSSSAIPAATMSAMTAEYLPSTT
ncbi:hypothetical protein QJS10_CPB15g00769 [Acorus calamus]|uniref:Uncharacterized protein n=1 Tax=Acorus calamus TaxID=4465 RepID=A0AAV9DA30_ACOCL|nr:hypothetical protein QJS10_CPB15g00769 [Acorus calamus]